MRCKYSILNLRPFHLRAISCALCGLRTFIPSTISHSLLSMKSSASALLQQDKMERMPEKSVRDRYFDMHFMKKWTIFCFFSMFSFLFFSKAVDGVRKFGNVQIVFVWRLWTWTAVKIDSSWLKIGSYHAPKAKHTFRISTEMTQNERVTRI